MPKICPIFPTTEASSSMVESPQKSAIPKNSINKISLIMLYPFI